MAGSRLDWRGLAFLLLFTVALCWALREETELWYVVVYNMVVNCLLHMFYHPACLCASVQEELSEWQVARANLCPSLPSHHLVLQGKGLLGFQHESPKIQGSGAKRVEQPTDHYLLLTQSFGPFLVNKQIVWCGQSEHWWPWTAKLQGGDTPRLTVNYFCTIAILLHVCTCM